MSRFTCCTGLLLVGCMVVTGSAWAAGEQTAAPAAKPVDSIPQRPLSADWAARLWLQERGITPTARIVTATARNTAGYHGTGVATATHIDLGAVIDTGKLFGVDGTLRLVVSDRRGRAVHDRYTGSYIQNQAFWGQGQIFRFNELSYERLFLDKQLSLKAGFYAMGNDFGGLPYVCNFNTNGQCGHPLGPVYSSGWLDNPTGQWGVRLKWNAPSGWYAQAGVYDVTPSRKSADNGWKLGMGGRTGVLLPVEVGYTQGKGADDYGGTYKVGYYLDTSDAPRLGDASGARASHRSGQYVQLAQRIWRPGDGSVRGVSVFGIATRADAATGLLHYSWEAGLNWRGPIASREDDVIGLGWTRLDVSSRLARAQALAGKPVQTNEQLFELNYGMQVAPWLILRPAVQYVTRPQGYSNRPDSWVFVLHAQATL